MGHVYNNPDLLYNYDNVNISDVDKIVDKCCKYNIIMYMKALSENFSSIITATTVDMFGNRDGHIPKISYSLQHWLTKSSIKNLFTFHDTKPHFFMNTPSQHAVVYQLSMLFNIYNNVFNITSNLNPFKDSKKTIATNSRTKELISNHLKQGESLLVTNDTDADEYKINTEINKLFDNKNPAAADAPPNTPTDEQNKTLVPAFLATVIHNNKTTI
jgi:hypothetical protein